MQHPPTFNETALVVRFCGRHAVIVTDEEPIQIMMPGAVMTIGDRNAARTTFRAMVEADVVARDVLVPVQPGQRIRRQRKPAIFAAVGLSGKFAPTVLVRAPQHSPSGCGQLLIRMNALTIVCDDLDAWRSQYAAWRQAYAVAVRTWGRLAGLESAILMYEARAKDRQVGKA
jgi:hypothetical protein